MDVFERTFTVRIVTENGEKMTNADLNNAFNAILRSIENELDENSIFMDVAQESVTDGVVVTAVVIPHDT